jgi:hypothetical protein
MRKIRVVLGAKSSRESALSAGIELRRRDRFQFARGDQLFW